MWGIDSGWASSAFGYGTNDSINGPDGHYTATVSIADTYQALGIVDAAGLERYLSGRAEPGDRWAGKPAPNKLGIDTWAWQRGTLTALRLPDRAVWQTSERDRGA